jgi:hypothetical protein
MKPVNAYRCEHCGKLYIREKACIEHEDNLCFKNPQIRPLCYDCKFYEATNDTESIRVYYETWAGESFVDKDFSPNKCTKRDCKLFNDVKLAEETEVELQEQGYEPMPNLKGGGCKNFERRKI